MSVRFYKFVLAILVLAPTFAHAIAVKGSATASANVLRPAADAICRNRALNKKALALARLNVDAARACPRGYTVKWGPVCNNYQGVFVKKKRWSLNYYCSVSCFANIRCNNSGVSPRFRMQDVNKNHPEDVNWFITSPTNPDWDLIIIERPEPEEARPLSKPPQKD